MKAVETTETIHEANFSRTISFYLLLFYLFTFKSFLCVIC